MLILYTGNGKGKTSASVGQAIRALGQGFKVAFGQFMKRAGQAGEQKMLAQLLGENFYNSGAGFFRNEEDRSMHRDAAEPLIAWALKKMDEDIDILILDESLYALGCDLILEKELKEIIEKARATNTHLVLSGRGVPEWLALEADLITEMGEVKHPYAKGHKAVKGIEF